MSKIRMGNINKIEADMINTGDNNINIFSSSKLDEKKVRTLFEMISGNIENIELKEEDKESIDNSLIEISKELEKKSENKNKNLIMNSLQTIKNVLEGVTGSLIASGMLYELGRFLNLGSAFIK